MSAAGDTGKTGSGPDFGGRRDRPPSAAAYRLNLARLLAPASLAVIGGGEAEAAIRQCDALGYPGEIHAVNPRREHLAGRPCLARPADLPTAPDAAFVAVPPAAAVEAVAALSARGAGAAVVYTSGFAEVGEAGARLQADLVRAAGDMVLVGPNCWGVVSALERYALWPDLHGCEPVERGVAIVSQSGNMAITLTMQDRSLPLAAALSVGNQAQTGVAELVAGLAEDGRVSAIGLLIEALPDAAAFAAAAERARERGVPIVALKIGRSSRGARTALTHTGSIAGDDACYDALFRRLGVARVPTLGAFLETLKLLDATGPLRGARVLSMSCSGGEAGHVADLAEGAGVELPDLDPALAAELGRAARLAHRAANPFDYHTYVWGDAPALEALFAAAARAPVDAVMLLIDFPRAPLGAGQHGWREALDAYCAALARAPGVAGLVTSTLPEGLPADVRTALRARGVAPLQGIDDALRAVAAAAAIRTAWNDPGPAPLGPAARPAAEPRTLGEHEAKRLLAGHGVAVPAGRLATRAEVGDVADALGYPVVMKAAVPGLAHKTEAGAVALGLRDRAAVEAALERMPAGAERFLIERMVEGAVAELLVGVRADPHFGLVLVLGSGGVLAELDPDAATVLLPARRAEIERALGRLRLAPVLAGYRGRPGADRAALAGAVEAIAAFAVDHRDTLLEMDVNPLIATPRGAFAADALIRLAGGPLGGG